MQTLFGDARETLPLALTGRTVGVFLHDSGADAISARAERDLVAGVARSLREGLQTDKHSGSSAA